MFKDVNDKESVSVLLDDNEYPDLVNNYYRITYYSNPGAELRYYYIIQWNSAIIDQKYSNWLSVIYNPILNKNSNGIMELAYPQRLNQGIKMYESSKIRYYIKNGNTWH